MACIGWTRILGRKLAWHEPGMEMGISWWVTSGASYMCN